VDLALNKMSDIEETPIETYNDVEPEFTGDANTTEVKLFGKWSFDDIEVRDISLEVSIFYSSLVT
jgi:small subunit ribosomal protein S5e